MSKAMFDNSRQLWGIMGGMGPLASAEFVKTIYELCPEDQEQFAPPLVLWSDPRMPDRTECILAGRQDLLLERLTADLERLVACDVTDIVICCVTIHQVTDLLPRHLSSRIISLLDVIFDDVLRSQKRYLMLCTTGTRQVQLFENHRLWNSTQGRIVLPSEEDQERIHELLYRIKQYKHCAADVEFLNDLVKSYGADSFIAGCTEIHVLVRDYGQTDLCLDPLMVIARMITQSTLSASVAG
ncbi:MAG TPA: amino acid racemase [Pyrinomonadaceae bacterium]|nr:amino acid racemase [Pyrinomonadaceae bacterium]